MLDIRDVANLCVLGDNPIVKFVLEIRWRRPVRDAGPSTNFYCKSYQKAKLLFLPDKWGTEKFILRFLHKWNPFISSSFTNPSTNLWMANLSGCVNIRSEINLLMPQDFADHVSGVLVETIITYGSPFLSIKHFHSPWWRARTIH